MYQMTSDVFKRPIGVIVSQREMDFLKKVRDRSVRRSASVNRIQDAVVNRVDKVVLRFQYFYTIRKGD